MDPARLELAISTCKAGVFPIKTTGLVAPYRT